MMPQTVHPLVTTARAVSGTLLGLLLFPATVSVLAHGGHGNEFQGGSATQSAGAVKINADTAQRLGLKVKQQGN
jgi:membrane fusion protein, heavy metal efflux system